jgi:hypothetical protein
MGKSLTVELRDINCAQRQWTPVTEVRTDVIQCSEWLPALSDDDVTHLLRGLEETFSTSEVEELLKGLEGVSAVDEGGEETFSTSEVEELLRGFKGVSTVDESGKEISDCYVNSEVRAVMSMDIDDFIV